MPLSLSRHAASHSLRARVTRRVALALFQLVISAMCAHAVVVRGHVTDALGKPVAGGKVQLVEQGKVVAFVYADDHGTFEIRSADSGRFTLLGSSLGFLPSIGLDFYAGATDVLDQDVVLSPATVRQEVSVSATELPTPLPQLTSPVNVIHGDALSLDLGVVDGMRQTPGAFLVEQGQTGGVTSLFMRGGNSTANLVLIDGVPAGDVGGTFDFGTVSSTAMGNMELVRGPDSAIYGTDAGASVISITTPRGTSQVPTVTYSGDAGSLHTWRNEATVGGTAQKFDYYAALSRLDTSNALQLDRYHSTTSAINLGYDINGNTLLRFTIHNGDSVQGVPGPFDFDGVSQSVRQADQDLYSGFTVENTYNGNWHNLLRYGIARKREQAVEYQNVGNYLAYDPGNYGPGYVGNMVTIRGANGYSATGQVQLYNGNNDDQSSNRDQLYYQSDYKFSRHLVALFGFRYDNERGHFNDYDPSFGYESHQAVQRTNFEYNIQLQGEFWDRLFYSAGGALEKNHLYGIAGTPKLGITYVPVRPTSRLFHGTSFRANAATGVQEPTLALEEAGLYELATPAQRAQFHLTPPAAQRSRSYDIGLDQTILGEKLVLKAGYFHNVFDHQLEGVSAQSLLQYFNIGVPCTPPQTGQCPLPNIYTAYVNSLAFRAQGAEIELQWRASNHLLVRGGYTNLSSKVVQSFSSDAVAGMQGFANVNPNFPNIPIGVLGPLVGARPFRRPPSTGYFAMQYTRPKFTMLLRGAMASRSDDSTFLEYEDLNGGNTLLLPNHDLDFGYVKLDLGITYALPHNITFFTQLNNITNDQHIGPIGYPGLPLTARAGLKIRLFGD